MSRWRILAAGMVAALVLLWPALGCDVAGGEGTQTGTQTETPSGSTGTTPSVTENATQSSRLRTVGYISYWQMRNLSGVNLKQLTHLIWQGVQVTGPNDATLIVPNGFPMDQIRQAAESGHKAGISVFVSFISPHGTTAFDTLIDSPASRSLLADNLKDLAVAYGLNGVDIDCESDPNLSSYSQFLKELYERLNPLGKGLSIAVPPQVMGLEPATAEYMSFINVMTYDMYDGVGYPYHSLLYESSQAMQQWADAGMPKDKLLMGIPLYGRDYGTGYYSYRSIVSDYNPTPQTNSATDPAAAGGTVWWNGPELVKSKVSYVKSAGLGGVMLYEVGTDAPGESSLLQVVFDEIHRTP